MSCCFNDYSLGHHYVFYASRVDPSSAYFFFNNCLAILILFILWVHLNYVDQVPNNSVGILTGVALYLGRMDIFMMLRLPIQEH